MKHSLYIGSNKYSLDTEDDVLKLAPTNFNCDFQILIGNEDILKNVQVGYKIIFQKAIDKYNKNNKDKEIKSYYIKINESKKQALATGILIKINVENCEKLSEEKIIDLFLNQIKIIRKTIKNFYIVSAILYFEKSFNLRIIGIPYIKDKSNSNSLEVRLSKSECFFKEKVEELRLKLQIQANKDFLKFFISKESKNKEKVRAINVNQLGLFENYEININ